MVVALGIKGVKGSSLSLAICVMNMRIAVDVLNPMAERTASAFILVAPSIRACTLVSLGGCMLTPIVCVV